MTQKSKSICIGLFVLGAIVLTVIFLLAFGERTLFSKGVTYYVYFDKSVKGLSKGAPVMFRGVRVGHVTDIQLFPMLQRKNEATMEEGAQPAFSCPIKVTLEMNAQAFNMETTSLQENKALFMEFVNRSLNVWHTDEKLTQWLSQLIVNNGLRVQLQTLSFLTGQLYIEMNLFPEEETSGQLLADLEQHVLPTHTSTFERMFLSISQKNFEDQVNSFYQGLSLCADFIKNGHFETLLADVSQMTRDLKLLTGTAGLMAIPTIRKVNSVLEHTGQVMKTVEQRSPHLLDTAQKSLERWNELSGSLQPRLEQLLTEMQSLAVQLKSASDLNAGPAAQLLRNLTQTSQELQTLIHELELTAHGLQRELAPDSMSRQEIVNILNEIERAAQSVRSFTDLLNRNPEVLIKGK
jgi:paraquat-inducible protein B